MRRISFFRRTLALVYGTVILFAVLIVFIYTAISPQLFARNKIDDLISKGQIIADYTESTLRGEISTAYLLPLISRSTSQWEATVWIVDTQGNTILRPQQTSGRRVSRLPTSLSIPMLEKVLVGEVATHIGSTEELASTTSSQSSARSNGVLRNLTGGIETQDTTSGESLTGNLVAVAVPISFYGEAVGAVFMAQSMTEVMSGMRALSNSMFFSLIVVMLLLFPVALFFASRVSKPLQSMRSVALTMAGGDLAVRADDQRWDEIGELGRALNFLSAELGKTISSLAVERNRLESLINGLSEGILAVGPDGAVTMMNPAVSVLLGTDAGAGELRESVPDVFAMFDEALASRAPVRQTIWQGPVAVRVSVAPLLGENGRVDGCVGILSDVTSAERLEQTRRDYVANVSHELRTPLTAMRALMEPLRDGLIRTEEQRQQTYEVVLRETMRLSRLVNDMLELSRLQSGRVSLSRSVFEPRPLLDLIRETYSAYAEDYQQTFVYDAPDDLPRVLGNPDRTQQVLVALLDNALKYTPEGGTVSLLARVEEGVVRVTVRDTGIGISAEDLPHVFDRFYKADKSHHSRGTGLGLAIAYEIMKHLGEDMTVQSTQGEGSAFSFTLHIAKDDAIALPPV